MSRESFGMTVFFSAHNEKKHLNGLERAKVKVCPYAEPFAIRG